VLLVGTGCYAQGATLTLEPETNTVEAGAALWATLTLSTVPRASIVVPLASDQPALVTVPASLTVPAGTSAVRFSIKVSPRPAAALTKVRVTALPPAEAPVQRVLAVYPPAVVAQLALLPGSVLGGAQSSLQVALSRVAAYPGVRVDLSNSRPTDITHAPYITVSPGKADAVALVGTAPVAATFLARIVASVATANFMSATLTVHAAAKRMLAASCTAGSDCASGQCADGVCCSSTCTGACRSCSLGATAGTCAAYAAGTDPEAECGPVSCAGHYWGWSENTCYRRADMPAANSPCDGAGNCLPAALACPTTGPGPQYVTCDPATQLPMPGSCTGVTAGSCINR
jgi:hypothetical protein